MITDRQTNFLYLADTLPTKYSAFYKLFQRQLDELKIPYGLLPATKDVWAVDYMPVQVRENRFVRFVYNPDYLRNAIKWRKTTSDSRAICEALNITVEDSDIVLDGGNVIRSSGTVLMCDKVFKENPHYESKNLIGALENLFEADRLVFIPTDPNDEIGHADGVARFLDDKTVLINRYADEDKDIGLQVKLALHNAGLEWIEIPYNPYGNDNDWQANGIYINYLQMKQAVFVPMFGMEEDAATLKQFEDFFKGQDIIPVPCNEVAKDGGVLNCISWNIMQTETIVS